MRAQLIRDLFDRSRISAILLAFALLLGAAATGALAVPSTNGAEQAPASLVEMAQFGPGGAVDPKRDCQTIRQCRFERGGSFRGCISTYTCRVCRFVEAKCEIGGRSQNCRELRCTWGG